MLFRTPRQKESRGFGASRMRASKAAEGLRALLRSPRAMTWNHEPRGQWIHLGQVVAKNLGR